MDPQIASMLKWLPLAGGMLYLARAAREYLEDWREAGPVAFDAGGFVAAKLLGGVFCGILLYLAARWISSPVVWLGVGLCVGIVSVAALARRQICESGIWHGFGLIPWIAVTGYRWAADGMLVISFHDEAASKPMAFAVSPEDGPRVQALLRQRVDVWKDDDRDLAEPDTGEIKSPDYAGDRRLGLD